MAGQRLGKRKQVEDLREPVAVTVNTLRGRILPQISRVIETYCFEKAAPGDGSRKTLPDFAEGSDRLRFPALRRR